MFLSIDINRLDNHITILQQELKEVRTILELMRHQLVINSANVLSDDLSMRRTIECLENQEKYIINRIEFLESTAKEFLNNSRYNNRAMEDAWRDLTGVDI